ERLKKFEIVRDELINRIKDIMKSISSKVAIPILTGIKIEIDEKGMTMTGSDSDITICTFIPTEKDGKELIKVEAKGSIILQARVIREIISKLLKNELKI